MSTKNERNEETKLDLKRVEGYSSMAKAMRWPAMWEVNSLL